MSCCGGRGGGDGAERGGAGCMPCMPPCPNPQPPPEPLYVPLSSTGQLPPACGPVRFGTDDCASSQGWISRSPNIVRPPPRFTHEEWQLATTLTQNAAQADEMASEQLQAEAARVIDEAQEVTMRGQQDVDWEFKQRLRDMTHWRDELAKNFGNINNEIDAMSIYRQRIETALNTGLCNILQVNSQILTLRDCRKGIDMVHDEAQKQVLHEMKAVEGIQASLKRNMEYCTEQLRQLRKTSYVLGGQLREKDAALEIDKKAYELDEHRSIVKRHCGACHVEYSNVSEAEWMALTEKAKYDSEKVINASRQLRMQVDSILRQISEDLRNLICQTNFLFEKQLKATIAAKEKLQDEHSTITQKVREMHSTICKLSKAMEEKQGAVALAETRLQLRSQRPNQELVRDPVQLRLIREVEDNTEQMTRINKSIIDANLVLRSLQRNQLELEDAINVKMITISIDETQVIPLRKTIRIQDF